MRNIIILFTIIAFPFILKAKETIVSGSVSGAEGQIIRMIAYDDFISRKLITLDSENINADGTFSFEFDIEETIMAYLDINYQRAEIFLEPGEAYRVEVKYDRDNHLASYFDRQGLVYDFIRPDDDNINLLIWKFNKIYNTFVMTDFEQVSRMKDKDRITEFKAEVEAAFPENHNEYLENYITYKIAGMEQYARIKGKAQLAADYFTGKPVLYNNVEYTFFFNEFFQKFLITSPDVITISDLIIAVNDNADLKPVDEALSGLSWLGDDGFRELVLLHGMKELYYNSTYKKPRVIEMIRSIKDHTSDAMHAKIAGNLLETMAALSPGTPAPDLKLTGIAGQKFSLKNIKGKPILLTFFRSGQDGTANAFTRLSDLFAVYKSGLEIISVSMDNDPKAYIPLANSGGYQWTFAHYGNDPQVFDLYNIKDLPMYVLIDVEGNIFLCPAPPPSEELEKQIMKVIH
ncbi:MAG TPA: thioredoxin-like domain-containing protein [Bacteroidales bacterium]|nr:thioredoxin-like domain-containing protein [Bacteroidales bacterium]